MEESGGDDRGGKDEISLLAEELIRLLVKESMVVPSEKPTLICTIWTEKFYNLESFKAQMRRSRGNYGRETFRKSVILFDRLTKPIERAQMRLTSSPFWIKIGSCLPKFDKIDLLHAISVTFGGVIRSEINGNLCRLKINLDVQKPLRRGIFVSIDNFNKSWISFKYEKLPIFCFGCGRMGHNLKECQVLNIVEKEKFKKDPNYTLALKAESNISGKEDMKFNAFSNKVRVQCSYTGGTELLPTSFITSMEENNKDGRVQRTLKETDVEKPIEKQEEASITKRVEDWDESKYTKVNFSNITKKTSWKRRAPIFMMNQEKSDNGPRKRKTPEEEID
ncbi:hypothetical protein Godav_013956, partial [Gossypium davidsonii]|nr:hypothetical protein [Gossypium davidsonii]